jgi:hypothetical protein
MMQQSVLIAARGTNCSALPGSSIFDRHIILISQRPVGKSRDMHFFDRQVVLLKQIGVKQIVLHCRLFTKGILLFPALILKDAPARFFKIKPGGRVG